MYYHLYDTLTGKGYKRVSVWSFQKTPEIPRFSSVTRERFLGLGPGAGSYFGPHFTLNTFSVPDYRESVARRGHAVALEMRFSRNLQILYDFYWRLYDTFIPVSRSLETLEYETGKEGKIRAVLMVGRLLKMMDFEENGHILTRRGAFWMHLAQNYFSLRAINTIWAAARKEPWPEEIRF
jgi:oxygen-independent coproporphyrinogen-3 oxidase